MVSTIRGSLVLFVAVLVAQLALAVAISSVVKPLTSGSLGLPSTLLSISEVVGGIGGLILAVALFSLQYHAERLGKTSFLVRYIGRKDELLPAAAILMALVGANSVVAILESLQLLEASPGMAYVNLIGLPLLSFVFLRMTAKMILSLSERTISTSVLGGLTFDIKRALKRLLQQESLRIAFKNHLEAAGASYSPYAHLMASGRDEIILNCNRRGLIADINSIAVAHLLDFLRKHFPGCEVEFVVGPGGRLPGPAILVTCQRTSNQMQARLPERLQHNLDCLLKEIFLLKRVASDQELSGEELLHQLDEAILEQANQASAVEFERTLMLRLELIRTELEYLANVQSMRSSVVEPLRVLSYHTYGDIAIAVAASGNAEKLNAFLWHCTYIASQAMEYHHLATFVEATNVTAYTYRLVMSKDSANSAVRDALDTQLHSVLSRISSLARTDNGAPLVADTFMYAAVAWAMRLTKNAIEAKNLRHALDFNERLIEQIKQRTHYSGSPDALTTVVRFSQITIAAWCVHLLRERKVSNRVSKGVFRQCCSSMHTLSALVDAWERGEGHAPDSMLRQRLGLNDWELPGTRIRAGVSRRVRGAHWLLPGFVSLGVTLDALRATGSLPPCHSDFAYDLDRIKLIAADLKGNERLCNVLPGISDADRLNAFVGLLEQRNFSYQLRRLRDLNQASFSPDRFAALAAELTSAFRASVLLDLLTRFEVPRSPMSHTPPLTIVVDSPKEGLVGEEPLPFGFLQGLSALLHARETNDVISQLKTESPVIGSFDNAGRLPVAIDSACSYLKARGVEPTAILIPIITELGDALSSDSEAWEKRDETKYGRWHATMYGSMPVYAVPGLQREVLVLDPKTVFTLTDSDDARVSVTVEDIYKGETARQLDSIASALNGKQLKIQPKVQIKLHVPHRRVGVNASAAALIRYAASDPQEVEVDHEAYELEEHEPQSHQCHGQPTLPPPPSLG